MMISRVGQVISEGKVAFFEREVAAPKKDEVIIRIKASALCGSDLHTYKAAHPTVPLPATIGHEFSGDIAALGSTVHHLSIGQRVTAEPCEACGVCEACLKGEYGSCDKLSFIYRRGDGAMADYITVKAASVFPLPGHMSYEAGALVEPTAVAVHAVRRADVRLGENVLVIGAGAIGLITAALCKRMGAHEVIVTDMDPFRLEMAKILGATRTVDPGTGKTSPKPSAWPPVAAVWINPSNVSVGNRPLCRRSRPLENKGWRRWSVFLKNRRSPSA